MGATGSSRVTASIVIAANGKGTYVPSMLLQTHFLTAQIVYAWAVANTVSLAMAARASTSSRADGLYSTLKTIDCPNLRRPPAHPCGRFERVRHASCAFPSTPSLAPARTRIYPRCRYVLIWGCTGYCRPGLGNQQDALIPKLVPAFSGDREISRSASVYTGPTCSAAVDRGGMHWLAGKWKISGDGSAGQAWSSFRSVQDII